MWTIRMAAAIAVLVGSLTASAHALAAPRGYDVSVTRTTYGVAHITAKTERGIGYGYAYSLAEDTVCTVAEAYATVNAERSRWFGPENGYAIRGNGSTANNLNSDFFYQRLNDERRVQKLLAAPPPVGPLPVIRQRVEGYVAGWNAWLRDHGGTNGVPDKTCRGKAWVRPITALDVYRRFYQLALLASSGVAIDGIGGAQPPTPDPGASSARQERATAAIDALGPGEVDERLGGLGSNALALGSDATKSGDGMLYGNPHFPWQGSERFFQSHLTIPGRLNVAGGSLLGVPVVLIGHTNGLAWSHTVSTARRFVPYELKLVPGSPTTYLVDGQPHEMTRRPVTVFVPGAGGKLEPRTRVLYATDQGMVLTSILGLPIFPWTTNTAYVLADANIDNFGRLLNHYALVNRAQTVTQLDGILRRYQGIPWVNTIAADSSGRAYYADIGSVPHFTDEQAQGCLTPVGAALDQAQRLPIADGSRSECALGRDPDAIVPGILGPSHMPSLMRRDYVTNMNDSHWLSNPRQPLTGFDRIIGDERTQRSLRTRIGIRIAEDRLAGRDGRPGTRFESVDQLRELAQGNRVFAAELWRDELVGYCKSHPVVLTQTGPVDVQAACPVLEHWDRRDDLDSRGALLFRRFAVRLLGATPVTPPFPAGPFATAFDADHPVDTPSGLNTASPAVGDALGRAVQDLQGAGLALDAPLRAGQYVTRRGERIPVQGGPGPIGLYNVITGVWDPKAGYTEVEHGSSFIQAVELRKRGGPVAESIVTYGQSTNPDSPRTSDQTKLFATKRFNHPPFSARAVARDPSGQRTAFAERRSGALREAQVSDGRAGVSPSVAVELRRAAVVVVTFTRSGRLAHRASRRLGAGRHMLSVPVPAGRYAVRIAVRAGGRSSVVRAVARRR